jgi:hypothetical protein
VRFTSQRRRQQRRQPGQVQVATNFDVVPLERGRIESYGQRLCVERAAGRKLTDGRVHRQFLDHQSRAVGGNLPRHFDPVEPQAIARQARRGEIELVDRYEPGRMQPGR